MRDKSTTRVLVVAGNLFFTLGMLAAIGPSLPEIARNTGSSLADAGALFTALFLGSIPSQLLSGWLNDRYGPRPILAAGIVILSTGLFGMTISPSLPIALAFMGFAGLGDGALVVGANVMVAQTFTRRSASALNLTNVFYGIGAIAGPALVGLTLSIWHTSLPPLWLISALLVLILVGVPGLAGRSSVKPESEGFEIAARKQKPFYLSPMLWIICVLLFVYVGVEVGVGGWVSVYMQRTVGLAAESAALVASAFYVALTAGRLLGAWLGTRTASSQLLMLSLWVGVIGGVGMLFSVGNSTITVVSVMAVGISFGPIYPTAMSVVTQRFPAVAGMSASVVMAAGSAGGMIIPWLQGQLIEGQGAASLAQSVAVGTLLMLALYGVALVIGRRRSQARELSARPYPAPTD